MSELSSDGVADAASIHLEPMVEDTASLHPEKPISNEAGIGNKGTVASDSIAANVASNKGRTPSRRRRRRTNWLLLSLLSCLCIAFLFYVVVLPEIELSLFRARNPRKKLLPPELEMRWASRTFLRICEFLFVGWFFYFGASIGSFLNVVAWRVPEGRTIVFGGSKCPFCNSHLSFIDNTPILGWLALQGRCRTCRLPISPRYLLIEIAVGAAFMWLAIWQLIRGNVNLPHWNFSDRAGLVNIVLDPNWPSIGIYLMHAAMFGVLIMLATANTGKKPFPIVSLCLIGFGIGSIKIFAPYLDLVAWHLPLPKPDLFRFGPYASAALSVLVGAVAGGAVGWVSSFAFARHYGVIVSRHWILQCFLVGCVLGWQSAVTIVVASLIVFAMVRPACRLFQPLTFHWTLANRAIGLNACFILVALAHHSLWFQIAHLLGLA